MDDNFVTSNKQIRIANFIIDNTITGIFIQSIWVSFFYDFELHVYTVDNFYKRIFSVLIAFFYYLSLETIWGKTIGKLITKTHVRSIDNNVPTFLQILVRSAIRIVPFDPLSFLGLNQRGWHDIFSKTKLVNDN
jgi:uncharacterized RDD family membrane protein YckC